MRGVLVAMTVKGDSALVAAGGGERYLDETIAHISSDEIARGLHRPRRAGLRCDEELEPIAELGEP